MEQTNKKSLSYKIQKNPFLLILIIVVLAVMIFGLSELTSKIREKKENDLTTTATVTEVGNADNALVTEVNTEKEFDKIERYVSRVGRVCFETNEDNVVVKAEYKNKDDVLSVHNGKNINNTDVVPVFCFYLDDGTMLECPGELKINNDFVAEYKLTEIDDFKNVKALADEVTIDYENILDNPFNLYLLNKNTGKGETIFGTHKESVEEGLKATGDSINVFNSAKGIKDVKITTTDDFIWIDIYYTDVASYTKLNNDFITNFVCFGFEKDGVNHKRDFIITEYDNLNMVRCKFDSYSLDGLAKEIKNKKITVKELFENYVISVWTSDYDNETNLFTING